MPLTARPVASPHSTAPVRRLALDRLAVGEVPSGEGRPVHPVRREVEPQLLGDDAGLVVDLNLLRAPLAEVFVVEPRRIAGNHHRTGQRLQNAEKRDMVGVRILEAVAALRLARRLHIGRVAVDQFTAIEVEIGQKRVAAAVVKLHRVIAVEVVDGPAVEINADVPERRRLALHDRTATKMCLDICGMGRHP